MNQLTQPDSHGKMAVSPETADIYILQCNVAISYSRDTNSDEYNGIDTENLLTLEKLKQAQRQEYIQVRVCYPTILP